MNPKLKSILSAVGWAALVSGLQALERALEPPYQGMVTALIAIIAGLAKYAPQTAVVMSPPSTRMDDRRVMEVPKVQAEAQKLVNVGEIPPIFPRQ